MGDADKPNKVQALADALYAQRDEGSQAPKRRPSVIPPPTERRSMPHRERRAGQEQRRVSLLPENERPYNSNAPARPAASGAYTTEVRRPVLLEEEESAPYPQQSAQPATQSGPRISAYGNEIRRSLLPEDQPQSLKPVARSWSEPGDTLEPEWNPSTRRDLSLSMPPAPSKAESAPPRQRSSGPPAFGNPGTSERKSLSPLETLKSLIPGRAPPQTEWQEDPRFLSAMESRGRGRKIEALLQLEQLLTIEPSHEAARREVFAIAVEMRLEPRIQEHVDWMIQDLARGQDHARVCSVYRSVRMAYPNITFQERSLVIAIISGDKLQDGRVVVDVTKLLLKSYPNAGVLPRAFMSAAQVQINEGRPDLARTTLQNLIARFPHDSLAVHARKKLGELG